MNSENKISEKELDRIIRNENREVVSILSKSRFRDVYYAFKFPNMNVIELDSEMSGFKKYDILGYPGVGVYISEN